MSISSYLETLAMVKPPSLNPADVGWMPGHCAPLDVPLQVRVRDEHGLYNLKSKVERRMNAETGKPGWFNVDREKWLVVPIAEWRYHPTYIRPRSKPKMLPK